MEVKKNITELKDKLADSLQLWIDERDRRACIE